MSGNLLPRHAGRSNVSNTVVYRPGNRSHHSELPILETGTRPETRKIYPLLVMDGQNERLFRKIRVASNAMTGGATKILACSINLTQNTEKIKEKRNFAAASFHRSRQSMQDMPRRSARTPGPGGSLRVATMCRANRLALGCWKNTAPACSARRQTIFHPPAHHASA
jgi:hypothetical protein